MIIKRAINWHKRARRSDLVLLYSFGPWIVLSVLAVIFPDQLWFIAMLNSVGNADVLR